MSQEPRDPPPPDDPEAIKPPHEGVVESVESEVRDMHDRIEEVVEQALPPRARLSAGRIAWIILLSFFVVILLSVGTAVFYFAHHTEWLAGELTTLINRSLAEHSNVVLEVRDLRGNPFKSVRIVDARIRFRGDRGPALLEAPSMTVSYAPWDLWFGRRRSIELVMDHPVIRLTRLGNGKLRVPEWRSGPRGPGAVRELEVVLAMRQGLVHMPEAEDDIVGWNFDGRAITGRNTQLTLQRMNWLKGPYGSVLQNLAGEYSAADSVRFKIDDLRTPDIVLRAGGGWRATQKQKAVHVEIDRVRWSWLAKVFDNQAFDVAGTGRAVIDARYDGVWRGRATADAVWDSLPVRGGGQFAYQSGRLRLEPLELTSPAGNLAGGMSYDKDLVDVHGQVTGGNPERWGPLGLDHWPKGDLQGHFRYQVRHSGRIGSHLDAQLASSELAGWRADTAWVMVDAPKTASDTFAVTMYRRGGRVLLGGRIDDRGWRGPWVATNFPLEEWPDGRASGIHGLLTSGRGTVEGHDGGLFVTGNLEGTSSQWLGMSMATWRLDQVSGALLPKPDLAAAARLGNVTFIGVHFDSASVGLHLGDNRAALEHVEAFAGDTTVSVAGRTEWTTGGRWHIDFDQARMRSSQFDWRAEGALALSGDPQGVVFDRFAARDSLARVELAGRWAAPGGYYDWTGRATELDLGRLGLPLDWQLGGHTDAVLRVTGHSGDPHWTLTGVASAPGFSGHRVDSLALDLEGGPARVEARNLAALLDGGRLRARLEFSGMARAWPDTLTGDGVQRWLAGAAAWRGEVRGDSLALDRLEALAPAARGWAGRINGTVQIAGSPRRPDLTAKVDADSLGWQTLRAQHIAARAHFRDDRLEVPELRITRANIVSTASGTLPLHVAMGEKPQFLDRPMTGRIDLDNGDLALLPLFLAQIGQASGRLDLHAAVSGTPFVPVLRGQAKISGGQMRLAGREELIEAIEAEFHFDQARAWMDQLTGRQGRHGLLGGRGWVDLPALRSAKKEIHYLLRLRVREFTTAETGLYVAQFDSNDSLTITQTPGVNDRVLPYVSGDLTLRRAVVLFDFANQTETEMVAATTAPLVWTYDLHLLAVNNLRWRPPDGDIEFSSDLTLSQSEKALTIFGDLHAIHGTYDFLSNRFTVRKADLNFDNVGGVNPVIDAEATTRINASSNAADQAAGASPQVAHTVTVKITGRADHPTIDFSSDPADWDQPTILSQLTVGRYLAGGTQALGDPLDNWVTKKINDQLSPLLAATFTKDVGDWQVAREQGGLFNGRGGVVVSLNRQLNTRLSLSVSQVLPGTTRNDLPRTGSGTITNPFERNIEAEYRLNRFFYVTTELAQRRLLGQTTGSGTTPDFSVNLHARWEY